MFMWHSATAMSNKHEPTTKRNAAEWRKKNAEHVREYKRAYYRKQKLKAEQDDLTLQIIADSLRSLAAQLDRIESALHAIQNGPAIKAASTRKMFS